jgi:nicotinamidase/pyrazinamidase
LIVVDVQNDFCPPEGSLAVKEGTEIIPLANSLRRRVSFDLVVFTQDWHPVSHTSFWTNNKDRDPEAKLFEPLVLPSGSVQVMWPVHCVQDSYGAKFHKDLDFREGDIVVKKGTNPEVDSYSGFFDNERKQETTMDMILKEHGIERVVIVGLAFDYCVGYTALDAVSCGYETFVCEDASRSVAEESEVKMRKQLVEHKVGLIKTWQIQSDATIGE